MKLKHAIGTICAINASACWAIVAHDGLFAAVHGSPFGWAVAASVTALDVGILLLVKS